MYEILSVRAGADVGVSGRGHSQAEKRLRQLSVYEDVTEALVAHVHKGISDRFLMEVSVDQVAMATMELVDEREQKAQRQAQHFDYDTELGLQLSRLYDDGEKDTLVFSLEWEQL